MAGEDAGDRGAAPGTPARRVSVPRARATPPAVRPDAAAPPEPVEEIDRRAEPLRGAVLRRRAPGRRRAVTAPLDPPYLYRIRPNDRSAGAVDMTEEHSPSPNPGRVSPLLWASGVNRDILRQSPTDQAKFQGLGSVVLFTATLAGVSMAAALHIALKAPWPVIVVLTLGWFLGILSLDRWLVASMQGSSRWYWTVLLALPRVGLALLFGVVLSMPVVLQIFEPEISQEVKVMHAEAEARFQASTSNDAVGKRISELESRKQQLDRQIAAGGLPATPDADPTLKNLQDKRDALQKEMLERRKKLTCEQTGDCGTRRPGLGPEARKRIADYNDVTRDFETADRQLNSYLQGLRTHGVQDAQAELRGQGGAEGVVAELARLKKQQAALAAEHNTEVQQSDGMAQRLQALDRLSDRNGAVGTAHLFVSLLFIAIELLPVLVKTIQLLGPPTVYDTILRAQEEHARDTGREVAAQRANVRRIRAADDVKYAGLVYDARRAALEDLAGRTAEAERRVGEAALEEWERRERSRIPDDLDRYVRTEPGVDYMVAPAGAPGPPGGHVPHRGPVPQGPVPQGPVPLSNVRPVGNPIPPPTTNGRPGNGFDGNGFGYERDQRLPGPANAAERRSGLRARWASFTRPFRRPR
ncbi:DUF4407 domain-containing protein [Actinomadura sp. GTD37]|uniref:DUF4407 domain-containing protein n=1 Tax=Actinomadura sp. GTD37 TaxID=1778030 RepID=UPI0035BF6A03